MTFRPVFDQRYVEDDTSGARVQIHSTKEIDTLRVEVEGLQEAPLEFAIWRHVTVDGLATKLKISVIGLESMLRRANLADHEANTIIVNKIIEGIIAFNTVWRKATTPILTSDRDDALTKGHPLPFAIPSDDQLTALSKEVAATLRPRPVADTSARDSRVVRHRQFEVYSADRKKRLVVLRRDDGHFQLIEESIRSYEDGDEYNPTILPFPNDGGPGEWSMIDRTRLDGIFGSAAEAEEEARRLLRLT